MSKKDKIETIEVDDVNLVPELLDGNHRVIPIVTGGDEPVEEVEVPEIIPILTLRSSVLFPGAITPITVGRDKSINLVRAVNAEGGILGAVLQRESDVEDPAPDDMYKVGTAARIIKILEMPNGNLTVILNGLEKVEITEYITTEPYFKARVTALRDSTPDVKSIEFEALVDSIRDVALNIINVSPSMPKEAAFAIKNIDSKRGIINFICSNMELTDEDRQSLLEAPSLLARARKLLEILIREQQLQVGHLHRILGHGGVQPLDLLQLLLEGFAHLRGPVLLLGLLAHPLDVGVGAVAQLVLDRAHLLPPAATGGLRPSAPCWSR